MARKKLQTKEEKKAKQNEYKKNKREFKISLSYNK